MMNILTLSSISNAYTSTKFDPIKQKGPYPDPPRNRNSNNASAGLSNTIHDVLTYWRNASRPNESIVSPQSAGSSRHSAPSPTLREDALVMEDGMSMDRGVVLHSTATAYSSAVSPAHARYNASQLNRRTSAYQL